jgi:hypothetical protein
LLRRTHRCRERFLVHWVAAAPAWAQVPEAQACEGSEVAKSQQSCLLIDRLFVVRALARERPAKIGVTEAQSLAHEAGATARGANVALGF